jgi:hypothetical protein
MEVRELLSLPPLHFKNQSWIERGNNRARRVAARIGYNERFASPVADSAVNMTVDPKLGVTDHRRRPTRKRYAIGAPFRQRRPEGRKILLAYVYISNIMEV